jgi:hypothetical protein
MKAHLIQTAGDLHFIVSGKIDVLALGPIPEGGVVQEHGCHENHLYFFDRSRLKRNFFALCGSQLKENRSLCLKELRYRQGRIPALPTVPENHGQSGNPGYQKSRKKGFGYIFFTLAASANFPFLSPGSGERKGFSI